MHPRRYFWLPLLYQLSFLRQGPFYISRLFLHKLKYWMIYSQHFNFVAWFTHNHYLSNFWYFHTLLWADFLVMFHLCCILSIDSKMLCELCKSSCSKDVMQTINEYELDIANFTHSLWLICLFVTPYGNYILNSRLMKMISFEARNQRLLSMTAYRWLTQIGLHYK